MTLMKNWLSRFDATLEREVDRVLAEDDRVIAVSRSTQAAPAKLVGADPAKMLATTQTARDNAVVHKQDIEAEIARLRGELANTELAIAAADSAIVVLRAGLDPLPMTESELQLDLNVTLGHTSNKRRLKEYAAKVEADG